MHLIGTIKHRTWRRLHNDELYDLYRSPNFSAVIKSNKMDGTCGKYGGQQRRTKVFGGET